MRICLVGNSGFKSNDKGGQTTKFRLYKKKIEDEGFDLFLVDLESFYHHPFTTLRNIKKGIILCDRVVLISGERACRLLIPFINKYKTKYNKVFILPLVGSSVLHYSLDHLSSDKKTAFLLKNEYDNSRMRRKMRRELGKIDFILPETAFTKMIFESYYCIGNCHLLPNFREKIVLKKSSLGKDDKLYKIIYLSRVMKEKGIFDCLAAISTIKKIDSIIFDIYGPNELNEKQKKYFDTFLGSNISYKGPVDSDDVISIIERYDLMIFPTRFLSEGIPGVISESLLAGTPILTSNFPNASCLLRDGYDSIFYEMFNVEELKNKLEWCIRNKDEIILMRQNCLESSKNITYEHNRQKFLKYICGL